MRNIGSTESLSSMQGVVIWGSQAAIRWEMIKVCSKCMIEVPVLTRTFTSSNPNWTWTECCHVHISKLRFKCSPLSREERKMEVLTKVEKQCFHIPERTRLVQTWSTMSWALSAGGICSQSSKFCTPKMARHQTPEIPNLRFSGQNQEV